MTDLDKALNLILKELVSESTKKLDALDALAKYRKYYEDKNDK